MQRVRYCMQCNISNIHLIEEIKYNLPDEKYVKPTELYIRFYTKS